MPTPDRTGWLSFSARSSSHRDPLAGCGTVPPVTTRFALVRPPTPNLAEGEVTHVRRQPVDFALAQRQWKRYVAALESHGWATTVIGEEPACPDAVFIEDTAVVYAGSALVCRPGVDSRKPEVGPVTAALAGLGYRMGEVLAPGTVDGGDVLKVGSTMYIGLGGRSNEAGIAQAADFFAADGVNVVAVPTTKVLHLKSAVTALPDGRVIGYKPVVDDSTIFADFLAMPEEPGAHVVDLGEGNVLMAASAPRSIERVRQLGYNPVVVDISEYEKLEGCVTCLSIRLRQQPR